MLFALEGFLLLSERFRWFAFNEHKGWTVLIAVSNVGAAMLLMFLWFLAALIFRRRFQFSLRSLLVLTVAVAIPCSWLAVEMKKAKEQAEAVQAIESEGGGVYYDILGGEPPEPARLRGLLGDNFFRNVFAVQFLGVRVAGAGLRHIGELTHLRVLDLREAQVTDAGLERLERLTRLKWLLLSDNRITDAGLKHLQGLAQLRGLWLDGT
jgi:hypothetical protein